MSAVFVSWSKDRSLSFAKALRALMARVLRDSDSAGADPGAHLVRLSEDLPKGANWFSDLAGFLENAKAGIICVTPENCASPWLLFEAGALIRCDLEVALFPVLLDLPPASVDGPLALIQGTVIERDPSAIKRETFDLIRRVADHVNKDPQRVEDKKWIEVLDSSHDVTPWDEFATAVLQIPPASVATIVDRFPQLFERKTFQEPFQECSDQRWLDRYAGARIAREEMEKHKARVGAALPTGAALAYERLSSAVDSYAMAIAGQLLNEREFGRDSEGALKDSEGRLAVCERRRKAIQAAYLRLRDPVSPVFDDARIYEELSSLEERKVRLIHPLEHRLDAQCAADNPNPAPAQIWQLTPAAASPWLYDRLVFYIHAARATDVPSFEELIQALDRELTLVETRDDPPTLVGLYYALEAVEERGTTQTDSTRLLDILDRTASRIEEWNTPAEKRGPVRDRVDANRKVRRMVERLRTALKANNT